MRRNGSRRPPLCIEEIGVSAGRNEERPRPLDRRRSLMVLSGWDDRCRFSVCDVDRQPRVRGGAGQSRGAGNHRSGRLEVDDGAGAVVVEGHGDRPDLAVEPVGSVASVSEGEEQDASINVGAGAAEGCPFVPLPGSSVEAGSKVGLGLVRLPYQELWGLRFTTLPPPGSIPWRFVLGEAGRSPH